MSARYRKTSSRPRRARRFATTGLAAMALSLLWAAPAVAAPTTTMGGPGPNATVTGSATITAQAEANGLLGATESIKSLRLVLTSVDNPGFRVCAESTKISSNATVTVNWSTTGTGATSSSTCPGTTASGTSAMNGVYRADVTVVTCTLCLSSSDATETKMSRTYNVSNAPAVPKGVKARLEAQPVVSWTANPEPDIKSYRIRRSEGGGAYKQVGTSLASGASKPTSWNDPCSDGCTPGTTLTYQVAAVRSSPVEAGGVIASSYSGASEGVTIPVPASPTPGSPEGTPGAPIPSNPQAIPAASPSPLPGVTAPTKQIVAPLPHSDKYAPTLPYTAPLPQDGAAPVEAQSPSVAAAREEAVAESVEPQRVNKLLFIAGALALLVAAMHLARGGGILLKGSSRPSAGTAAAGAGSASKSRRNRAAKAPGTGVS